MSKRSIRVFLLPLFACGVLAVFLACGSGEETAAPAAAKGESPLDKTVGYLPGYESREPENGGTLARALPSDVVTLNAIVAPDFTSYLVYKWIFDPLIDYDIDMKPVGVLAESWEVSEDNLVTTFHLRKNVTWHDGEPFDADDVVFSYDTVMDPTVDAINKRPSFAKVEKVERVDAHTVKVNWKQPYAPGIAAWNFHIMPEHVYGYGKGDGESFNRHPKNAEPVGTGPFRFSEWKRGERVVLLANDDYFNGRPHLDKVIFKVIPQPETRLASFKTGELDVTGISADQWNRLKGDRSFLDRVHIFEYYGRAYYFVGWNQDGSNPFFADKKVRQAMTYAMNRKGVVDRILLGHGTRATGPFYIKGWESNPAVKPYPYDPAKASALLEDAGWSDSDGDGIRDKDGEPFSFECLTVAEAPMFARFLEIFQQDLMRVGVKLEIRTIEWKVFQERTHRHAFQAYLTGWRIADDPDPYHMFHSSQAELLEDGMGVGQNDVSYRNERLDALIEEQLRTMDFEARQKVFWKIHELVAEDQPHTYLFAASETAAVRNDFQNVRVSRAGYGLFTWYPSLLEWWVPKDRQ